MANYTCQKCKRVLNEKEFYQNRQGEKTELCKKCLTMHVDNFDESTYVWILEKLDFPYIPGEWNMLRDKIYAANPKKMNGMSVLGRYISKMHLKQYKNGGYADSEELIKEFESKNKVEELDESFIEDMKQQLEEGKISEAQYKTLVSTEVQYKDAQLLEATPEAIEEQQQDAVGQTFYNEDNYMKEEDIPDPAQDLSDEDKLYLVMKWGRLYTPSELVSLEKKYREMSDSFDIQDSDTVGTLILICKTYLKLNQAVDEGDMDAFQKLSRVYDSLRKSAKFTAAQNKEKDSSFISSVGELVDYCEREGGAIPKFEIVEPLDKIDKIIDDLKQYNKTLIYSDTTLAAQIEDYLKQKIVLEQRKVEKALGKDESEQITNDDFVDFFNRQAEAKESDEEDWSEDDE